MSRSPRASCLQIQVVTKVEYTDCRLSALPAFELRAGHRSELLLTAHSRQAIIRRVRAHHVFIHERPMPPKRKFWRRPFPQHQRQAGVARAMSAIKCCRDAPQAIKGALPRGRPISGVRPQRVKFPLQRQSKNSSGIEAGAVIAGGCHIGNDAICRRLCCPSSGATGDYSSWLLIKPA